MSSAAETKETKKAREDSIRAELKELRVPQLREMCKESKQKYLKFFKKWNKDVLIDWLVPRIADGELKNEFAYYKEEQALIKAEAKESRDKHRELCIKQEVSWRNGTHENCNVFYSARYSFVCCSRAHKQTHTARAQSSTFTSISTQKTAVPLSGHPGPATESARLLVALTSLATIPMPTSIRPTASSPPPMLSKAGGRTPFAKDRRLRYRWQKNLRGDDAFVCTGFVTSFVSCSEFLRQFTGVSEQADFRKSFAREAYRRSDPATPQRCQFELTRLVWGNLGSTMASIVMNNATQRIQVSRHDYNKFPPLEPHGPVPLEAGPPKKRVSLSFFAMFNSRAFDSLSICLTDRPLCPNRNAERRRKAQLSTRIPTK